MGPRANVRSVEAVRRFRPALIRFQGDLAAAIAGLRQEVGRTLQWLDHDCPAYWQQRVRNGFDRVAEARTQLARRQMITIGDHRSECIDEKKALARAKQDLEAAQEKIRTVRQWSIKAHRAADEYQGQIGRVEQSLGQRIPQMIALIDRMARALESYASIDGHAPSLPETAEEEQTPADANVKDEAPDGLREQTPQTAESVAATGSSSPTADQQSGNWERQGTDPGGVAGASP